MSRLLNPAGLNARAIRLFKGALALFLLFLLAWPAGADEEIRYRWKITGLAALIIPAHGDGTLTAIDLEDGGIQSELHITSADSEKGDYYRYASRRASVTGGIQQAWSSYRFRGKEKSREAEVSEKDVVDIASGIALIRRRRPTKEMDLMIWSDGKVYSVKVLPLGSKELRVESQERKVFHYAVRGRPGGRKWKGSLELWLADNPASTPLRIALKRAFSSVRLDIVDFEAEEEKKDEK